MLYPSSESPVAMATRWVSWTSAIPLQVDPESPVGLQPGGDPAPFPSYALANTSGVGYGVAKSGNLVFFASQIDSSNGVVYGVSQEGGSAVEIATGLKEPRGLSGTETTRFLSLIRRRVLCSRFLQADPCATHLLQR